MFYVCFTCFYKDEKTCFLCFLFATYRILTSVPSRSFKVNNFLCYLKANKRLPISDQ